MQYIINSTNSFFAPQVYKGRWHGTSVAAKVLKNSDAIQAESFRQECALLEQL